VIYEALSSTPGLGLSRLPPSSYGDVFLDLEGDPFVDEGGLEFLFGYAFKDDGTDSYTRHWALSRPEEKGGFERFIDFVTTRLGTYPDLHIYHFAPYEPAALKRLMGRYATREDELDRMLRAGLFIDLYAVVRHGIRASVESYSIKKLEPLYHWRARGRQRTAWRRAVPSRTRSSDGRRAPNRRRRSQGGKRSEPDSG
jgi:predicted RecB family nuclease